MNKPECPSERDIDEILDEWEPNRAESWARAAWLNRAEDAEAAAQGEPEFPPGFSRSVTEWLFRERADAPPCTDTAEAVEESVSWRRGDNALMALLEGQQPYRFRLALVLLGRCSGPEADVLADGLADRLIGTPLAPSASTLEAFLQDARDGAAVTYVARRWNRLFFCSPARAQQVDGIWMVWTNEVERGPLEATDFEQWWRFQPAEK